MRVAVSLAAVLCAPAAFAVSGPWDSPPALPAPSGTIVWVAAGDAADLENKCRNIASNSTVMIPAGTYQLTASTGPLRLGLSGAVTDIALRGATGDRDDVVIRGPGMSVDTSGTVPHCIMVENAQDVQIANLSIGEVWFHPLTLQGVSGADRVHVYNCRLFDAGEQFLKCSAGGGPGVNDCIVEYCVFEFTTTSRWYYTEGIDVHTGARWIVRKNLFRNIRGPAGDPDVGGAIDFWNNSTDTLVEGNTIWNCRMGVRLGIINRFAAEGVHDHQRGIVRNNFIYREVGAVNNPDNGIIIADCPDAKVLHNTVILNDTFDPGGGPVALEYRWSTGVTISRNLADGDVWQRTAASGTVADNIQNAAASWFVDAPAGDLHLDPSATTAIDQVAVDADATLDWDWHTRPGGTLADIGADELADPPDAPSLLAATATSPTQVDLSWTDNSSDETSFRMERKTGAGAFSEIDSVGANATFFSDFTVSPSTTYTYRIRALGPGGYSAYSNEDGATTPAPTPTITVSSPTDGSTFRGKQDVDIVWTSSLFAGNVDLELSDDDGVSWTTVIAAAIADTGSNTWELPNQDGASFRIRVCDAADEDPAGISGQFSIASIVDTDNDRMDDSWETGYWGDLTTSDGTGDSDSNGVTDLEEFWRGTHPADPQFASADDSVSCAPHLTGSGTSSLPLFLFAVGSILALRHRRVAARR